MEVPYEQADFPDLATALTTSFTQTVGDGTLVLAGGCPRCGHVFRVEIPTSTTPMVPGTGLTGMAAGDVVTSPVEHVVACSCGQDHVGCPPGEAGCGALAKIVVVLEAS